MKAHAANLMEEITSDDNLQQAYEWLCNQRKDAGDNSDVWRVRQQWLLIKPQLRTDLCAGTYQLIPVRRVHGQTDTLECWSALDALVLKATALVLTPYLAPHLAPTCFHVAGHGGAKAAVRAVVENLKTNTFVFRSNIASYYASIDHDIVMAQLSQVIDDSRVLGLVRDCLRRTIDDSGCYAEVKRGLSLGCPWAVRSRHS